MKRKKNNEVSDEEIVEISYKKNGEEIVVIIFNRNGFQRWNHRE